MLHKDLSQAEYLKLSELLDESLEMTPEMRSSWLANLARTEPQLATVLREMFTSQDVLQAKGFLDTANFLPSNLLAAGEGGLKGKLFGPYCVLSLLGDGGMGSVWLAERVDGLFSRRVALKLVHPSLKSRVVTERFSREREILASLSHPNIARLLDAGFAEDGQPYLALDYVTGTPLTTYCDDHRLSIRARLELFRQVLSAVQYAHAHLVIHRDLKPANILVTQEGQVQLLDFGIAKLLTEGEARETELTQLGGRALTPDYAAPEQVSGAPITTAADIYALGVMLYELLTGERPYKLKRESRGALEEAILQDVPQTLSRVAVSEGAAAARSTIPRKLAGALRGDLDTIVSKSLKKSPAERYATANAFGEDIGRYLRGEVVLARPDSLAYRSLKFARRYWVGMTVAGVLVLTLAGGLAATTYEARVASAQRDTAFQAQLRSLTQTAAGRLKELDVPGALGIILDVLPHRGATRSYTPEALSVFQEARAADAQILAFTGHTDRIRSVAFSPDGRRIVTASYDKTARIWDAGTGQQTALLRGHTDRVISAAFSPDGQHVATASFDRTIRIWEAATGREIMQLSGHTDGVRSVAFSPDGERVISGSYDKTARIWDAASGREISMLTGHAETVTSAVFSSDGRRVLTASYDKTVRIWDAATGREIIRLIGHTDRVTSARFSSDNQRVITASGDKTARIWDSATGRETLRLSGHTQLVAFAAFSNDGGRAITASYDETARIWDTATGRETMRLNGHTDAVESADFSSDGRLVVTASSDKSARIWDAALGHPILTLTGHSGDLASAVFSPDGRRILTASFDKTARIWDAASGREIKVLQGHADRVVYAAFSSDGGRVVTASLDKTARIWDVATGREIELLKGHTELVFSGAFSPDGGRVVTASNDRSVRIWDAATGQQIRLLSGHAAPVEFAAYSPDGRHIVTASNDKTARIWDSATGQQLLLLSGHSDVVEKAAYSRDGRFIVTSSDDKTARIWDAASGREIMLLSGHTDQITGAGFSPDGRRVVTAGNDKTARIWDVATGQQLVVFRHPDAVETAVFSPDGSRIVTASDDGIARIWEASAPAIGIQIASVAAAQFDALSGTVRFQLGLPAPTHVRRWPVDASRCDETAGAPYDPERRAAGVMLDQIVTDIAIGACADKSNGRATYQYGRALMAQGKFSDAERDFKEALTHGYRSARVDLGMLLSQASSQLLDVPTALSLFEQAWRDGVTMAAFELGSLYENGVHRSGSNEEYGLSPDVVQAWLWYQRAADAGQPSALARFGERDDAAAFSNEDPARRKSFWLSSFIYYAAAVERARVEDWPDDAWRNWRYRRASLARLLVREGMEQAVAEAYEHTQSH